MSAHKVNRDLYNAGKSGISTKCYDSSGNIIFSSGVSVPTGAGYSIGSKFCKTNAATGATAWYLNQGTAASASFVLESAAEAQLCVAVPITSLSVDMWVFVAPYAMTVSGITCVHAGLCSAACTIGIRKITANSQAPGAAAGGSVIELLSAALDIGTGGLGIAANTLAFAGLSAVAGALNLAANDRIAFDFSLPATGFGGGVITLRFTAI